MNISGKLTAISRFVTSDKILQITGLLLFLVLTTVRPAPAQQGRIYGRVFMTVSSESNRTFRGRIYRNRLASQKTGNEKSETKRTAFEDVIIAVYPLSFSAPPTPLTNARLIQRNAEFVPHVLPVTPGTEIQFINLDKFYHNVFSITPGASFNIGRRPTGTIITRKLDKPGEVKLFCEIHSQMNASVYILNTPFFTQANRNGVYLLDKLPAGKYRVEVSHPDSKTVIQEFELSADQSLELSFNLNQ